MNNVEFLRNLSLQFTLHEYIFCFGVYTFLLVCICKQALSISVERFFFVIDFRSCIALKKCSHVMSIYFCCLFFILFPFSFFPCHNHPYIVHTMYAHTEVEQNKNRKYRRNWRKKKKKKRKQLLEK